MALTTILTGIKPTGAVHLGNYVGAIRPAIRYSNSKEEDSRFIYFIADYHAMTSNRNSLEFKQNVYSIAATWIALGLDIKKSIFFKQSDVKEVFELQWLLSCMTPKGDMNRAHSYKDRIQKNEMAQKDTDFGINMGLYSYPVLMAADILLYDTDIVPVGKDQQQHVEIARSIAKRINETYQEGTLILPKESLQEYGSYVVGLDGRKMSKSYNNTIALFESEKKLRKLIMKIKTDSSEPETPKDPDSSLIMDLYKCFATEQDVADLEKRFREGIAWGHAKEELFQVVNKEIAPARQKYNDLMEDTDYLDSVLADGAKRAKAIASETMRRVRSNLTGF